jgi:transcriptional regulator with XRE-family HTH domain
VIGERIRWYRTIRGLSARALADLTGGVLTRAVIANLESGRKIDVTVTELVALAEALNVRPGMLDGRVDGSVTGT